MCSACANISPDGTNTAAEQSALSLIFGEYAVRRRTTPMSSATAASRLRATSNVTTSMVTS